MKSFPPSLSLRARLLLGGAVFFVFCHTATVRADALPEPARIQQALSAPSLMVGNYTLNSADLSAFYGLRGYRPVWSFFGARDQQIFAAYLDSIEKTIRYHGLESGHYPIDLMRGLSTAQDDESHLRLEMLVTDTLLRLAHELHGDTGLELDDLYPGWKFHRREIDIPDILGRAVAANKVNELFEQLSPRNPAYRQLAQTLRRYEELAAKGEWPKVTPGVTLRPDDRGPRVGELRARLTAEGYLPVTTPERDRDNVFDNSLYKALKDYQKHNALTADGHAGDDTFVALDVSVATRVDQIRANMERWRHMPDDYPPPRVAVVNIADASIDIFKSGHSVYHGPVIVGQVERQTPFIRSAIRSMIINPSWHVPDTIARADILPKLREDPHYLEKLGIVIRGDDDDPYGENVDWKNLPDDEFNYMLQQQPGKKNSLGRVKFDFDNDFAVYLHGTPHQELFSKDQRTFSSGCVRLRDPAKIGQVILADTPGDWDVKHIEREIKTKKTKWVDVKNPMPLYILYWTVFTDESGQVQFRNDVYGYDQFLMESLKSRSAPAALTNQVSDKPAVAN